MNKIPQMKKLTAGVVTSAQLDASTTPVLNLINILSYFTNKIHLITLRHYSFKDNHKIYIYKIHYKIGSNIFLKILKSIYLQLKISFKIAKVSKNVDYWIFFIGGSTLILPALTVQLLRKKVVLVLPSSYTRMAKVVNNPLYKLIELSEKINFIISNKIILYSPNLIKEYDLEKYSHKILISHRHFLNFDKFKIIKKFNERDYLIGYIGRLSGEKGVMNFIEAIPEILKKRSDIKFIIEGDGELRDKIEAYLNQEKLNDKVKLTGWIQQYHLPEKLNELKLLVLPSYTEGLPNIMLEAMACGTPVLATHVGAIPDIIEDCKTGFILENNSPECIANNVIRCLEYSNSDEIVRKARQLVEKEFVFEAAVEKYKNILLTIGE